MAQLKFKPKQKSEKLHILAKRTSCFCAFCKVPRKVYKSKNLSLVECVGLIALSFVMTQAIWSIFDVRGLIILGLLLFTAEIFTQVRWRQSMICNNCGFDPIVYIKDPGKAGLKIKDFLVYRSERPEYLLKPQVNLPHRATKTDKNTRQNSGQNLSLRG